MPYIGQSPTQTAFVTDTFSGNGSTTAFTMSVAPANTASALVAVSGVLQDPSTYSVSGTTLTFSAAPPTGTGNISVRFLGIPASGVTTTAYRTQTEFTATAGQTTFTPASYTVGFIDVYRNGVLLGSADFTATNGTTVVLAIGANAGDLIETVSFFVSSVLNAIPATPGAVSSNYIQTSPVLNSPVIDTLRSSTGVLATQNGMTGIAKAWVNFNGTGTVAINSSFNVSSITDNGTGDYTVNFTTAMPNANYAATANAKRPAGSSDFPVIYTEVFTTGSVRISNVQPGTAFYDSSIVNVAVFSS
jgi:hypothetical protein